MRKKLLVLSILFGFVSLLVFRFTIFSPSNVEANKFLFSATYSEQAGYEQFVKQLPPQKWDELNWESPFYMENGGLPRVIRNCDAYIDVNDLLVKQEAPEEELHEGSSGVQQEARKKIALTFDDGPNRTSTVQILEILEKYDVKATFFVIGQNVEKYPDIVKAAADQGHEIASHSWSHKNLTKLNNAQLHAEIDQASTAIFNAIGQYPTSYRPPYGAMNDQVRNEITLNPILWNIDTLDWQHKSPAKTLASVKAHAKDGGVILMHDIHQQSADAVEAVIQYLLEENYELVTTGELYK